MSSGSMRLILGEVGLGAVRKRIPYRDAGQGATLNEVNAALYGRSVRVC